MLASSAPPLLMMLFSWWFCLCSSLPYWPGLALSLVWAKRADLCDAEKLRFRAKVLAGVWAASIVVHSTYWAPHVMDW